MSFRTVKGVIYYVLLSTSHRKTEVSVAILTGVYLVAIILSMVVRGKENEMTDSLLNFGE